MRSGDPMECVRHGGGVAHPHIPSRRHKPTTHTSGARVLLPGPAPRGRARRYLCCHRRSAMKKCLSLLAWVAVASLILYAAAAPGHGVVFHGPLACLSVGLI